MNARTLLFVLGVFLTELAEADPNVATILNATDCSKARHTLAGPDVIFQKWKHTSKPIIVNHELITKLEGCDPEEDQYLAIDFHHKTRTFFITNVGQRLIEAYDLIRPDYYRRRTLFKGISKKTKGLVVDWEGDRVYWADPAYDAILMTSSDGSCQLFQCASVIVGTGIDNPTGLAVHPYMGRLFWTDENRLEMVSLEGSGHTLLKDDLRNAQGISIDFATDRLYLLDRAGSSSLIVSSDLDGKNTRILVNKRDSQLFDLDVYQGYIVMSDQKSNSIAVYSVVHNELQAKPASGMPLGVVIDSKDMGNRTVVHDVIPSADNNYNRGVILLTTKSGLYRMERNFAEVKDHDNLDQFLEIRSTAGVYTLTSDAHTNKVYFFERSSNSIKRVRLSMAPGNGKMEGQFVTEKLTNAVQHATDLAIDWISKNLYWADKPNGQIVVSRDDGNFPVVLLEKHLQSPRTIAVDPAEKYIFWGDREHIGRAQMDGSWPVYSLYIVRHGKIQLAADPKTKRVYFNDNVFLCYGDYEGKEIQRCQEITNPDRLIRGLDIMNDYVIWSAHGGGLYANDKHDLSYIGHSTSKKTFDGISFHHMSQQPLVTNKCTEKPNGGCEQLCLPNRRQEGLRCACTVGFWSRRDGSCRQAQLTEPYLVFPDRRLGHIYQASLILYIMYGKFQLQSLLMPVDVAYDNIEKKIYWSDARQRTISSAHMNGSHQHIVFADKHINPLNIAVDSASQLVYFVDYMGNVFVVSLKTGGTYRKLVNRHIMKTEDVAVDPSRGLMFITGVSTVKNASDNSTRRLHCVSSVHMDGSNFIQIATDLGRPKAITVYKNYVLWADAKHKTVERVEIDTYQRSLVVDTMRGAPIDLVVHAGYVYWTETGVRYIFRTALNYSIPYEKYQPLRRFFDLAGLDVASDEIRHTSVCEGHQCSGTMCLPTPRKAVCVSAGKDYNMTACTCGIKRCSDREQYTELSFCRVPALGNGTVHDVTPGSYVPDKFRFRLSCNPGFRLKADMFPRLPESSVITKPNEFLCHSPWERGPTYTCQWDMPYTIQGTFSRGIVKFYNSSRFLVPSGIRSLDVICIGGGGGGYSKGHNGGDGGNSTFGRYLRAEGGKGGRRRRGGRGGFGYRYIGGNGGDVDSCRYGGAAGQLTRISPPCSVGSANCPFCGAGGYGRLHHCNSSVSCLKLSGGCSGGWSVRRSGLAGSDYGGGAGSLDGGSGGGGGFSRKRWLKVVPGEIIHIQVGSRGYPSAKSPGNGIVVVSWGRKIEIFLPRDPLFKSVCQAGSIECSCL